MKKATSVKENIELNGSILDEYVKFIADKNNLSIDEAQAIINKGWAAFGERGWFSSKYKEYCEFNQEVFQYKYNDSPEQVYDFYKFHERTDFFRYLSAVSFMGDGDQVVYNKMLEIIISQAKGTSDITLVDYGYGLATNTLFLMQLLKLNVNTKFKLVLVDVKRPLAEEFISWLGKKYNIQIQFIEVTKENPHPKLPKFNFIQVKDSFEHIYQPEIIVDNINKSMKPGGIAYVTYDDEREEMSHVTPDLKVVRDRFKKYEFLEIGKGINGRGVIVTKSERVNEMVMIPYSILTYRMQYVAQLEKKKHE